MLPLILLGAGALAYKYRCSLGIHKREWEYTEPKSCLQLGTCIRCENKDYRTEHIWGDWEDKEDEDIPCLEERICERCGETEKIVEHEWGRWQYEFSDLCEQVRFCEVCGDREDGDEVVHCWGVWDYESPNSCTLVRFCRRCPEKDYDYEEEHQWDEEGICERCGDEE